MPTATSATNGRLLPGGCKLVVFGGRRRQALVMAPGGASDSAELIGRWADGGFGQVIDSGDTRPLWFLATNPKARIRDPVRWLIRAILVLAELGAFGEARGVTAGELFPTCRLPADSKPQPGLYSSTESLEAAWLRAMRDRGGRHIFGFTGSLAEPRNAFFLRFAREQLHVVDGDMPATRELRDRVQEILSDFGDSIAEEAKELGGIDATGETAASAAPAAGAAASVASIADTNDDSERTEHAAASGGMANPDEGRASPDAAEADAEPPAWPVAARQPRRPARRSTPPTIGVIGAAVMGMLALAAVWSILSQSGTGDVIAAVLAEPSESDDLLVRFIAPDGATIQVDALPGSAPFGVVIEEESASQRPRWAAVGTNSPEGPPSEFRLYNLESVPPERRYAFEFFEPSPEGGWAGRAGRFGFRGYALLPSADEAGDPEAVVLVADDTHAPSWLLRLDESGGVVGRRFHAGSLHHFALLPDGNAALGGWANRLCRSPHEVPCSSPGVVWLGPPPADGELAEFPPACSRLPAAGNVLGWVATPATAEVRGVRAVRGEHASAEVYLIDREDEACWTRWVVSMDGEAWLRGQADACRAGARLEQIEGPHEALCEAWHQLGDSDQGRAR